MDCKHTDSCITCLKERLATAEARVLELEDTLRYTAHSLGEQSGRLRTVLSAFPVLLTEAIPPPAPTAPGPGSLEPMRPTIENIFASFINSSPSGVSAAASPHPEGGILPQVSEDLRPDLPGGLAFNSDGSFRKGELPRSEGKKTGIRVEVRTRASRRGPLTNAEIFKLASVEVNRDRKNKIRIRPGTLMSVDQVARAFDCTESRVLSEIENKRLVAQPIADAPGYVIKYSDMLAWKQRREE